MRRCRHHGTRWTWPVAVAAINAHYTRCDIDAPAGNGVRAFRNVPGQVVVVGAFPGVDGMLPNCARVEADPRPGEFPTVALDTLLPDCGAAVVNASALVNRGLPRLLRLLRLARHRPVALVGPATPLSSRLRDYGRHVVAGFVVEDADGLAAAIRAGATAREFGRFGRFVHLPVSKAATSPASVSFHQAGSAIAG